MHPSHNILRSSVVGCARKNEQSKKKGVIKEFFSEIVVSLVWKGSYTTFNTVKIWKIWEKIRKIRKTWSVTKKRSSEILAVKMEIFSERNVISEILVHKKFFRPPKLSARSPPLVLMYASNTVSYNGLITFNLTELGFQQDNHLVYYILETVPAINTWNECMCQLFIQLMT